MVTRGKCKTIWKPVGKVVVENPFPYGFSVWSKSLVTRGKCKTVWKPVGKVVVENSFLYGNRYISVWNRGIRGYSPNKRHFALQSAYLAKESRGEKVLMRMLELKR